jgi:hypothetical protein
MGYAIWRVTGILCGLDVKGFRGASRRGSEPRSREVDRVQMALNRFAGGCTAR